MSSIIARISGPGGYGRVAACLSFFSLLAATAWGQVGEPPRPAGLTWPEDLLERFLPAPTEADEQALAEIVIAPREETRFGRDLVEEYRAELRRQKVKIVAAGRDVEYVRSLVRDLQPFLSNAARYPSIQVYLLDAPQTDARSFPGGTLFFYRGLLELAGTEAALVGVIGHELSHLDRGHQLVPLKQSRLIARSFAGQGRTLDPQLFLGTTAALARLLSRPFRPQDEAAADRDAVVWTYRAGYDPRELSKLFLRLQERNADRALPVPVFFRSHPPFSDRSSAVLDTLTELAAPVPQPLYVGRENLERRIPRSTRRFAE